MQNGRAFISGVSRGIGRGVALRLAQDGFDIAGCYRSSVEQADKTEAELRALGVRTHFARCDVADGAAVDRLVHVVEEELGPLSVAVANAGITRDRPMVLMAPDEWHAVLETNLSGTWNVCRAVAFRFLKRKAGSIVAMSSVAGLAGNAGQSNYAAAKAGIVGMSQSLAKEVAPYGVRVNVVAPGFIDTDMTAALTAKQREAALSRIPLRRMGTVEDVADLVAFVVSARASYITGQVLRVDGGMVL